MSAKLYVKWASSLERLDLLERSLIGKVQLSLNSSTNPSRCSYRQTEAHGPSFFQPPPDLIDAEEEYKVDPSLPPICFMPPSSPIPSSSAP